MTWKKIRLFSYNLHMNLVPKSAGEIYCRARLLILCIFQVNIIYHFFLYLEQPHPTQMEKKKFSKFVVHKLHKVISSTPILAADGIQAWQRLEYQTRGLHKIENSKTNKKKKGKVYKCNNFVSMSNLHIDQSQLLADWYKQFPCFKNKKMTIVGLLFSV